MTVTAAAALLLKVHMLGTALTTRIKAALDARNETIEVEDLGDRANELNDRIQGAL